MATIGFSKSASVIPVARQRARAPAMLRPWVEVRLRYPLISARPSHRMGGWSIRGPGNQLSFGLLGFRRTGQLDEESGSLAGRALEANRSAVGLNDLAHDPEAETEPAVVAL